MVIYCNIFVVVEIIERWCTEKGPQCKSPTGNEAISAIRPRRFSVGPGPQNQRPAMLLLLWRTWRVSDKLKSTEVMQTLKNVFI